MDRRALLLAPALLVLLAVFALPVGWLLSRAFTDPAPGLQNFAYLLGHPVYLGVLLNTVLIAGAATPICLLLGFPFAHAMAHGGPRLRRWLTFTVLVPFWTSLLVRSFALLILLGRAGPVNALLLWTGLIRQPLPLLYNLAGVLIGAVQVLLPFAVFPIYAVMRRIDGALLPAALTLGCPPHRAFLRVYLPLTLPGVFTAATLVFISTLGYFITPALLGGPRQVMVAQLIQSQIGDFGHWGVAGALALLLMAATFALLGLLGATVGLRAVTR